MNITTIDHDALRLVVRKSKAQSWLHRHRWMALFVVLPTLLAAVYYGLIASPIYVSQSSFIVKSPGQRTPTSFSLANLVQTSGLSAGQEQTKEVVQYIQSRNALGDLQREADIRDKFSRRGADFLSRFPTPLQSPSFENLYRYYGSMVGASVDGESGLAVLEVRAFTPEDAYEINSRLLNLSEGLVNRLNQRAEGRAIEEAEQRVRGAEGRLRNARVALSAYRNQQDLIDPTRQAAGVLEISNKLIGEQAALQAQLDLMLRVTPRGQMGRSPRSGQRDAGAGRHADVVVVDAARAAGAGHPLRPAHDGRQQDLQRDGDPVARPGHRGQHRDLQLHGFDSAALAAGARSGVARDPQLAYAAARVHGIEPARQQFPGPEWGVRRRVLRLSRIRAAPKERRGLLDRVRISGRR